MEMPTVPVTFRCFDVETDVDVFHAWVSNPSSELFSRPTHFFSTRAELLDHVNNFIVPHPWFRIICDPKGKGAGFIYFTTDPDNACCSELTFNVARVGLGKWIAAAAVKKAVETRFAENRQLRYVNVKLYADNSAARSVVEKMGFCEEEVTTVVSRQSIPSRKIVTYRYSVA